MSSHLNGVRKRDIAIYALLDPRDNKPRYVGQAVNPETRFFKHQNYPANCWLRLWIQDLAAQEMGPILDVLEWTNTKPKARKLEKLWIKRYAKQYHLYNIAGNEKRGIKLKTLAVPVSSPQYQELTKMAETKGIGLSRLLLNLVVEATGATPDFLRTPVSLAPTPPSSG